MATVRRTRIRRTNPSAVVMRDIDSLIPDTTNPRQAHEGRLGMLRLSLAKLGFLMPVYVQKGTNKLLSGHQRQSMAREVGYTKLPVMEIDLDDKDVKGINILFNRVTNDFTSFDTGAKMEDKLDMRAVAAAADSLPDADLDNPAAMQCKDEVIATVLADKADLYDRKAVLAAHTLLRKGIRIPAVVTHSGDVVNGIYRMFSAAEIGEKTWPVVRIPDAHGEVARQFLNYLSMDYKIDGDFKNLLRAGAFRRASNDKGAVPKSYRFWANGCRTLSDKESYTQEAWAEFRRIHGNKILDFGAGLDKVAPYLREKGFDALSFEPYLIEPDSGKGEPSPEYSRLKARRFLQSIANPDVRFDSIFMSAVMNSIPFLEDRLMVLAIVNALCSPDTAVYGTCRDISDFNYEYGGERRSTYFVMDTEPGVRIGDITSRPKLQKFHTQEEADRMFKRFWGSAQYWGGGNIFYFKLENPKRPNIPALMKSLEFEFSLPFTDGSNLDSAELAKESFMKRLGLV